MRATLSLGRIAGIKVQIHWTFWLLILFVVYVVYAREGSVNEMIWNSFFILALFVCVVLHEFGHALGHDDLHSHEDIDNLMYGELATGIRKLN